MNEIVVRPPRLPVAGVNRNPLLGLRHGDMQVVPVDASFYDLYLEIKSEGLLICVVNGEALSRLTVEQRLEVDALEGEASEALLKRYATEALNWKLTRTRPGDVIEWNDRPQDREDARLLLQVVLLVSAFVPGLNFLTPYLAAANIAYNLLVPPRGPKVANDEQAQGIFSTALAGNAARLDQPIWRLCGRPKVTPPFACQPYVEYQPSNTENPNRNTDQIYHAVFAIGIGNHVIERAFIGKTTIGHFQDVTVSDYLAPGVQPSVVQCNVFTSEEVSELEMEFGIYVGGYTACRPGDRVLKIGIDVGANQGLSVGVDETGTATWQVEYCEIDDFGRQAGEWRILANESRTDRTMTPQRWTNTYTLPAAIRCEVRVVRTNDEHGGLVQEEVLPSVWNEERHEAIQWIGLRAYLEREAPLNPDTAHYEVVMRSSKQLSNVSQRDFSMIVRAYVRQWNPVDGWGGSGGGAEVFTRNAAWWLADLWTNPVWGEGLPDERIDLQGLYEWSLTLDSRQDHFDYAFTSTTDSWDAAQLIARSGRARAFRRNGIYTIARDELVDLPIAAFTGRNTQPKSMMLHASLPGRDQPNGVIVEYLNNISWDTRSIECPCPGFSVTDPVDTRFDAMLPPMDAPVYVTLDGITGSKHAEREGVYQAYDMALRRQTVSATTEMEAVIVTVLDPVLWQPPMVGYGQCGDVAFWDEDSLIMGLTEPPDFSAGTPYLTLVRDDGTLTTPVAVVPGPASHEILLPDVPDFDLVIDDGLRERPKFILGPLDTSSELVKLNAVRDGGKTEDGAQLYDIEAVIDDDRVHLADNYLLPSPGEIQDPIDAGDDLYDIDVGGGAAALVRLTNHSIVGGGYVLGNDPLEGGLASFTLHANGTARQTLATRFDLIATPDFTALYTRQWINTAPVEPAVASLYEVYATVELDTLAQYGVTSGFTITGIFDTWQPMTADRTWSISLGLDVALAIPAVPWVFLGVRLQIRRVGSTVIQANALILLQIAIYPFL